MMTCGLETFSKENFRLSDIKLSQCIFQPFHTRDTPWNSSSHSPIRSLHSEGFLFPFHSRQMYDGIGSFFLNTFLDLENPNPYHLLVHMIIE